MDEKNKIKEVLDILKIKSKLGKEFKAFLKDLAKTL